MIRISIALAILAVTARADPPIAAEISITCKPTHAMVVLGNRFYVKCDKAWTNPTNNAITAWYFSTAASDATQVAQAQAAANAAIVAGKNLQILFRTSSTENPAGCKTDDCRKMTAIGVLN
jgi:hypothetical protein